jgi:hypothetical protein
VGFEPTTTGLQNRCSKQVNPESDKTYESAKPELTRKLIPESEKQAQIDTQDLPADLAQIVTAWPNLPEHIKAAIMALVKTA